MSARIGVVTFPGTLDDVDVVRAVRIAGAEPVELWHGEHDLHGVDAVVLPGGFSYGDHLRCGAIASRAPLMQEIIDAATGGMPVLGICNGFQILCEARLLPGALSYNRDGAFICKDEWLTVENNTTAWTSSFAPNAEILIPLKSQEGRYVAPRDTITQLEDTNRVVFRYSEEAPNGSTSNIAGICSENGRIVGLMPHPEHAVEALCGPSTDGLGLFVSAISSLQTSV